MNNRKIYNALAGNYDLRQTNPATKLLKKREERLIKKFAFGKVLDLGCGTGEHLSNGFIGIDSSEKILEIASKSHSKLLQGDIESLPIKAGSIDTVLCMYSTLNMVEFQKAVKEMGRVLKKNGKAIISVTTIHDQSKNLRGDKKIKKFRIENEWMKTYLFDKAELAGLFEKNGFRLGHFETLFGLVKARWGDFQPFSSKEKALLMLEKLASGKPRVYLAVFEKTV